VPWPGLPSPGTHDALAPPPGAFDWGAKSKASAPERSQPPRRTRDPPPPDPAAGAVHREYGHLVPGIVAPSRTARTRGAELVVVDCGGLPGAGFLMNGSGEGPGCLEQVARCTNLHDVAGASVATGAGGDKPKGPTRARYAHMSCDPAAARSGRMPPHP
jgi:hypothetical protein